MSEKVQLIDPATGLAYRAGGGGSSGATGPGTAAQATRVTYASDGSTVPVGGDIASGVTDAGNPVKMGGRVAASFVSAPVRSTGQRVDIITNVYGMVGATLLSGSTNSDGQGLATVRPMLDDAGSYATPGFAAMVSNGASLNIARKPNGFSRITSTAATGSPTVAKSSAGDLGTFLGQNGAAVTYLQLYNKASAPTIGTDTPVLTFPIPANAAFNAPAGLASTYFAAGLAYAFTTDAAGNTAAAANAVTAFALTYA